MSEPVIFHGNGGDKAGQTTADKQQKEEDMSKRKNRHARRRLANDQAASKTMENLKDDQIKATPTEEDAGSVEQQMLAPSSAITTLTLHEDKIETVHSPDDSVNNEDSIDDHVYSSLDASKIIGDHEDSSLDASKISLQDLSLNCDPQEIQDKGSVSDDCIDLEDRGSGDVAGVEVLSPTSKRFLDKVKDLLEPDTAGSGS
jgi:hypothetical protein